MTNGKTLTLWNGKRWEIVSHRVEQVEMWNPVGERRMSTRLILECRPEEDLEWSQVIPEAFHHKLPVWRSSESSKRKTA